MNSNGGELQGTHGLGEIREAPHSAVPNLNIQSLGGLRVFCCATGIDSKALQKDIKGVLSATYQDASIAQTEIIGLWLCTSFYSTG